MKMSEMIAAMQNAMLLHGDVDCRMYINENDQEYSAPIDMAVVEAEGIKVFYVAEFPTFKEPNGVYNNIAVVGDDLN